MMLPLHVERFRCRGPRALFAVVAWYGRGMFAVTLAVATLVAQADHAVLVLPVDARGVGADAAVLAGDILVNEFRKHARARVVSHGDVEGAMTQEQRKQLAGCDAASCAAEIAASLDADYIVLSRIGRLGDEYVVSVTLVDARTATAVGHGVERVAAGSESAVLDPLPRLVVGALESAGLRATSGPVPPLGPLPSAGPPAPPVGKAPEPAAPTTPAPASEARMGLFPAHLLGAGAIPGAAILLGVPAWVLSVALLVAGGLGVAWAAAAGAVLTGIGSTAATRLGGTGFAVPILAGAAGQAAAGVALAAIIGVLVNVAVTVLGAVGMARIVSSLAGQPTSVPRIVALAAIPPAVAILLAGVLVGAALGWSAGLGFLVGAQYGTGADILLFTSGLSYSFLGATVLAGAWALAFIVVAMGHVVGAILAGIVGATSDG